MDGSEDLQVGQHVIVRDASNNLLKATVAPVPRDWRDRSGSEVRSSRGQFAKVWVNVVDHIVRTEHAVPWPEEDVFSDLAVAEAAVAPRTEA
jgi:hypothetical protein